MMVSQKKRRSYTLLSGKMLKLKELK